MANILDMAKKGIGNTQKNVQSIAPQPATLYPTKPWQLDPQPPKPVPTSVAPGQNIFGMDSLFDRNRIARHAAPIAQRPQSTGVDTAPVERPTTTAPIIHGVHPLPENGGARDPQPPVVSPPVLPTSPVSGPGTYSPVPTTKPPEVTPIGVPVPKPTPVTVSPLIPEGNHPTVPVDQLPDPVVPAQPLLPPGNHPTTPQPTVPSNKPVEPRNDPNMMPENFSGGQAVWEQGIGSFSDELPTLVDLFGTTEVDPGTIAEAVDGLRDWVNSYNWPPAVLTKLLQRIDQVEAMWNANATMPSPIPAPEPGPQPVITPPQRPFAPIERNIEK